MPGVLKEIGLMWLPHYTALRTWFTRIPTNTWRAFLSRRAEKRTGHAAIDSTGFDRDHPSRHYSNHTNYHIRVLKVTTLEDVETLNIATITRRPRKMQREDRSAGPHRNAGNIRSLAANHGYDAKTFRDELRENGIRPLINYCIYLLPDHAHNA